MFDLMAIICHNSFHIFQHVLPIRVPKTRYNILIHGAQACAKLFFTRWNIDTNIYILMERFTSLSYKVFLTLAYVFCQ